MLEILKQILFLLCSSAVQGFLNEDCSSFMFESDISSVISSTYYEAGEHVNISNLFQSINTIALPSFCRVRLNITTNSTANSVAAAEVWLPSEWDGRILTGPTCRYSASDSRVEIDLRDEDNREMTCKETYMSRIDWRARLAWKKATSAPVMSREVLPRSMRRMMMAMGRSSGRGRTPIVAVGAVVV